MRIPKFVCCFILLAGMAFIHPAKAQKSFEMPRTKVLPIKDSRSGRQYELYVKLPEKYLENKTYPVVYTTDAMWHIEILAGSLEYILGDVILVGISWEKNVKGKVYASRFRDYTITKSKKTKRPSGEASNHLTFIRNDVIKYVEKNYRADPGKRTYFGYSLGGLFGAYILLTQPDTFKNYILGSPVSGTQLLKLESRLAQKRKNLRANVFVSIGGLEKKAIRPVENFVSRLKSRNYAGLSLQHVVLKSVGHATGFPMAVIRSLYWLSDLQKK